LFVTVMDFQWPALADLWSQAIDVHDHRPLTRTAALAALAVGSEDHRRAALGIPSIFGSDSSLRLARRGSP
jgi:hypothetical protein